MQIASLSVSDLIELDEFISDSECCGYEESCCSDSCDGSCPSDSCTCEE